MIRNSRKLSADSMRRLSILLYGTELLLLITGMTLLCSLQIHAYIDPSIMTYTVQAVAGILIASATFIGIGWRKLRRKLISDKTMQAKKYSNFEADDLVFKDPKDPETEITPDNADIRTSAVWQKLHADSAETAETAEKVRTVAVMTWLQRLAMVFFPALLAAVTMILYIPSSIYLSNINEFVMPYGKVFPVLLKAALALIAAACVIGLMFNDFTCRLFSALLLALGLAVYVQTNFLNPALPAFNGLAIDWSRFSAATSKSNILWIGMFILIPLIAFLVKKFYNSAQKLICLLLSAVQVATLGYTAFTTKPDDHGGYYFVRNKEFELSKTSNTIVIVLDTFDAEWFDAVFLHNNEFNVHLKDFTFFENTIAGAAPTSMGLPYMLSGVEYQLGQTTKEYRQYALSHSTLLTDLKNAGVSNRIYTDHMDYLAGADMSAIENAYENTRVYNVKDELAFTKRILKMAAFFEAPMVAKKNFGIWENPLKELITVSGGSGPAYEIDDPQFYIDFQTEHFNPTYDNPVFTLYHLFGAHPPFHMNENAERIETATEAQDHINQMIGCMKICWAMLQQLKDIGLYDSSTIIITADHGGLNYFQYPTLLVKRPDETHDEIAINTAPVTFDNLYNTFAASLLPDTSNYGQTLYDVPEDLQIARKHVVSNANVTRATFPDVELFRKYSITEITFYGHARDIDNISYSEETSYRIPSN